jgi:hypothetical protein
MVPPTAGAAMKPSCQARPLAAMLTLDAQQRLRDFIRKLLTEGAAAGDVRNDVAPDELASYRLHALTAASSLPSKAAVRRLVTVTLGTCEIEVGTDGGCPPPLQIQIQPLCTQLETVARAPIWKGREVRGAPVGTIDSAPVLFTNRVQVKVYRGQGSDPGLPMRALRALRSVNDVEPTIDYDDPIPSARLAVLLGTAPCSA